MMAALAMSTLLGAAFSPGEQTTYEVSWLGVTAGLARVTVGWPTERDGHTVWPLVCVGQTTSLGEIYRVRDRFTSWWDPRARLTRGADLVAEEGRERRRERFTMDRDAGQAVALRQKAGQAPTEHRFDMPDEQTMDLASAAFSLRDEPFVVGAERELAIFTGSRVYRMAVRVEARERLRTGLGELEVFRVTVNGEFGGKLATQGLMTLYFTADERQLPVRGEAELVLGTVRLEAVNYAPGVREVP